MATNLGWEFYKGYFKDIDYNNLSNPNNEIITNEKIERLLHQTQIFLENEEDEMIGNIHFKASTTYPGLLLGSGYLHELPDVKGQAILGFDFDYTTGLPIIRGSSIKGVLRSAFPLNKDKLEIKIKNLEKKSKFEEIEILKKDNISKFEYIQETLNYKNIDISELEKEIFDNNDIFYDAQIISSGRILEDDYLAPHKEITKNPKPLRFIKVASNVTFRFDFELSDGIISKEKKRELFKTILEDLGIGAKTNVGYGKFENFETIQTKEEEIKAELQRKEDKFQEVIKSKNIEELERFKIDYQYKIEEIDKRIKELKNQKEIEIIKNAYETIEKNPIPNYINSFIEKYQNNVLADEYVQKAKNLLTPQKNNTSFEDILKITKFKQLESFLKKYKKDLNESQKEILKNHILNMNDKIKRKKFPFSELNHVFKDDTANKLADELELK